jgi:thioredoxin reductase (NADPH)
MRTNVPGVFAAGDCVGRPFQVAKAVGEGNVAAISASEYVEKKSAEGK